MKEKLKKFIELLKRSAKQYKQDDPVRLASTTAYFTVFAIAPIIIIIMSAAGILIGQQEIQEKIFAEFNSLIGEQGTQFLKGIVENYQDTRRNVIGTIIGFAIFLFSSTTLFMVLQRSLNFIWRIRAKPSRGILKSLKDRLLSLGMVLSLGFLLLISLIVDAAIAFFKDFLSDTFQDLTVIFIEVANFLVSFGIIMLMFAMIYKFLPDAQIKWKVTWTGAFITTVLFFIGKTLIGLLISNSNIGLMYGAAGSLFVILLWVFYSSITFFFGAEITQQYAEMYHHEIKPKDYAVAIEISEHSNM
ncbi:MAG: YihY/virulence factor BrkB family protein [Bacteroidales bacterium]